MTDDVETQAVRIVDVEQARHFGETWATLVGTSYQGLLDYGVSKAGALRLIELKFCTQWATLYESEDDDL
jgi:hypothetical protein